MLYNTTSQHHVPTKDLKICEVTTIISADSVNALMRVWDTQYLKSGVLAHEVVTNNFKRLWCNFCIFVLLYLLITASAPESGVTQEN
jgi:hypothetical protein